MTPVHFMGREIGWFVTDRLGGCRYWPQEQFLAFNRWAERKAKELERPKRYVKGKV